MPYTPLSQPYPEFLIPPHGSLEFDKTPLLIKTFPVCIFSANFYALIKFSSKIEHPNPKSEELTILINYSSSSNFYKAKTGPKTSWFLRIEFLSFISITVGLILFS